MKDGRIIETGTTEMIFTSPSQEYTKKLLGYAKLGKGGDHSHGLTHFHGKTLVREEMSVLCIVHWKH